MENTHTYPIISVIIPAYNVEDYITRCLDSAVSQTYPNIEIVVVNDGSTDNTKVIADSYAAESSRKITVIHQDNQGVTSARLAGINVAAGEWFGFADADDVIMPDMYERLYQNAVQYHADISHCGHKTIVDEGKREHDFCYEGRFACQNMDEALRDLLEGYFEPSLCTKLVHKDVIKQALVKNAIDTDIVFNEDLLFNFYFFSESGKSVFEDFCGYHYMARSDSATRGTFNSNKIKNPIRVWQIIMDNSSGNLYKTALRKYLTTCMMSFAAFSNMPGYGEDAKTVRKELISYRDSWGLLRRNDLIKLRLLMLSPALYRNVYGFYEKYIQKKRYE